MRLSTKINGDKAAGSDGDFALLPDGWYEVKITNAEIKQTKAGTGSYVSVRFDVTSDKFKNRVLFGLYNIDNPNPAAEEIGRNQLSRLAGCCGIKELEDTDMLLGKHVEVKVTTRKSAEWGDRNEIKDSREGQIPNTASDSFLAASQSSLTDDSCPF